MTSAAFGVPVRPQPRDPMPDTVPDEPGRREEPGPAPREPGPAPSPEPEDDPRPSQDPDPEEKR